MSQLTDSEAREFHKLYNLGFWLFTIGATAAHWLMYTWKPWF
jgi:light-harvesting complex 1 beta chain